MNCYEEVLKKSSKENAPWYIIPADDKPTARLLVANIINQQLNNYPDIKEPSINDEVKRKLNLYINQLEKE